MRVFSIAFTLPMFLLLFSCKRDGKKMEFVQRERMEGEAEVNPMVEELDSAKNLAILATLQELLDDSLVFHDAETGNLFTLGVTGTDQTRIKGGLTLGDEYAVLLDQNNNSIELAINLRGLSGKWFYDLEQHRGFKFEWNGIISSINTEDISFREWKLLNGRLYIYYLTHDMVSPDRHEYLVEPAEILVLDKDNFTFQFLGHIYECHRQKEVIKMEF